jgi:hypothetical protein
MGSVGSSSSSLSNLLQTLTTESPELSSILSQPNVQAQLAKDTPGDLVQLSDQALQLQQVSLLFGGTSSSQAASDSLFSEISSGSPDAAANSILQTLGSSLASQASGAAPASTSPAETAASTQAQQLESLFGITPSVDPTLNTLG